MAASNPFPLSKEALLQCYRTMRTIRDFEERLHVDFGRGDIPGFVHLYAGEEATAVGIMDRALEILKAAPPDVMNHNLETVPRLYREARPGSDYQYSLDLLRRFKAHAPGVPTKSGLMVGLGETDEEILAVMRDLRAHGVEMLTVGQYLAPSGHHLPVRRYVHPDTFRMFEREAQAMGFQHAAVGAMVRSSYHADQQAHAAGVAAA